MAPRKTTKAAEEMTEEKKTTKAKKVKEPKEPNVSIVLQFQGRNTDMNNLVEAVKSSLRAEGHQEDIDTISLYVQPENGIAYYVVNENDEGRAVRF